jgi:hypothetical protein
MSTLGQCHDDGLPYMSLHIESYNSDHVNSGRMEGLIGNVTGLRVTKTLIFNSLTCNPVFDNLYFLYRLR